MGPAASRRAQSIGLDADLNQHVSSVALAHVESGVAEPQIRQVDRFENRWPPPARRGSDSGVMTSPANGILGT